MLKLIQMMVVGSWLALAWPASQAWAAKLDQVPASDPDYQLILSLQEKAGSRDRLPASGADKEAMLTALAALSDTVQASGAQVSDRWEAEDYDALFALLQNYREQLKAARARMAALEARGASLAAQETELEKRLDRLPPDGFKINGEVRFVQDTLWLLNPAEAGGQTEFIHGLPGLTLFFVANKGLVSAKARYDINTILGDTSHQEGLRLITVEMRTPLVVQTGDFFARMTRLTLWRNEDYEPFEPEPFVSRRQRLREDVLLTDNNAWDIKAIRLLTDLVLFEKQTLNLEVWWTVPAASGQAVYHIADGTPYVATNNLYMAAWKMGVPLDWLYLQYTGTKYWQSDASGGYTYNKDFGWPASISGDTIWGFNVEVHSLSLEKDLLNKALKVKAEYAYSLYSNPNDALIYHFSDFTIPVTDYHNGGALLVSAVWDSPRLSADLDLNYVTSSFVAPMAQGRTFDPSIFSTTLLMENTTYNSGTGSHGSFPFATYNETFFNNNIVPPLSGLSGSIQSNSYLQVWPLSRAAQPYGAATPNRMGLGGHATFHLFGGALEPLILARWEQEPEDEFDKSGAYFAPAGTVVEVGAGFHADLRSSLGLPVKCVAGLRHVSVANQPVTAKAVSQVEYATNSWDAGVEWISWTGGNLALGFVAEELYGNQYLPRLVQPFGIPFDTAFPISSRQQGISLAMGHKVNDWTRVDLSATQLEFKSRTDPNNQDVLRQYWAKFSIFF